MHIILVVFYLFTRLAGYSMDLEINRVAYKLIQTPRVIKKNSNNTIEKSLSLVVSTCINKKMNIYKNVWNDNMELSSLMRGEVVFELEQQMMTNYVNIIFKVIINLDAMISFLFFFFFCLDFSS